MTEPPAPPPGGGPQPPDWGQMGRKLRTAQGPNRTLLIAGLLFFVDSFLPWYGVSGKFINVTIRINISGWHAGGVADIAILLGIAVTAVAALEVLGAMGETNRSTGALALLLSGGAFVFVLLRWLTETRATKYGLFIALVLSAVMTYAGYQKVQAEKA